IGWETESAYYSWPLLSANGGYVFQRKIDGSYDARDTGVAHPGAVRGADYLAEMMKSGVLPEGGMSYQEAEDGMKSGRQAMWINGPWAWESLAQAKVNFGVAPLPSLNGKPARPFVGVMGAMITTQSQNKTQAVAFLEQHLLKTSGLAAMNRARAIGVPASKQMFWSMYSDPRIRASMDSIYAGRAMPNNTEMTLFWQHLTTALRDINAGEKPRLALEAAANNIRGTPMPQLAKKVVERK
ncbi:MAG TPA: extracellular solute-binding protein, partial [Albitalea sp.]|nr:extracellular solute-binding protein [Albitalea sp.]